MLSRIPSVFFGKIDSVNGDLGVHRNEVFKVIILCAALVVVARTFAPFEIRQDQSLQLEAAQRLYEGLGLTTTRAPVISLDIVEVPAPIYLTDWPPAFSLLVAACLFGGLPLGIALKAIYALVTLIGWIGWALIANYLIARHFRKGIKITWIYFLVPALLPVLYTPWWGGTDIFLWAGVPYVVLLLYLANYRPGPAKLIVIAGLLFGFLCSVRYASFFVAIAASLILFQTTFPSVKLFLQRSTLFFLPALMFILPVFVYVNQYRVERSNLPQLGKSNLGTSFWETAGTLSVASVMLTGFPWLVALARHSEKLNHAIGFITLAIIIALPLILLKSGASSHLRLKENFSLTLSFLPLSLFIFLTAIALMTGMIYIAEQRYFEAVGLTCVFLAFDVFMHRKVPRLVRVAFGLIVAAFVAYTFAYLMFAATSKRRAAAVHDVLSFTPSRSNELSTSENISYPQHRLYTRKESSRQKLRELHNAHPDAIFFILKNYQLYIYDNLWDGAPVTGLDLRVFPEVDYWQKSYTSKAVNVFWVLDQSSAQVDYRNSKLQFIPDANLKIVYNDSFEKTMILKSNFPAGYKFISDEHTAHEKRATR